MKKWEIDYNNRQYRLMISLIEDYQNGDMELHIFVHQICALIDVLEGVTDGFRNKFYQAWSGLEETYACALEFSDGKLNQEDKKRISKSICMIKELIDDNYTNTSNDDHVS